MEDTGAMLCQISALKGMLDQVNQEIEASIQVTRLIESEIVKSSETEGSLAVRESDLTKSFYMSQFEINGLIAVAADARISAKFMEEELCCLRMRHSEIISRMNDNREGFTKACLEFQRDFDKGNSDELGTLLSEKEFLENETCLLEEKNSALKYSMSAFVDEILEDLYCSNSDLYVEIQNRNQENNKLLKDIDYLKTMLLSTITVDKHHPQTNSVPMAVVGGTNLESGS